MGGVFTTLTPEKRFIQKTISDNCVVVFARDTCPYCISTKEALEKQGIPYCGVSLNKREDEDDIKKTLGEMTGQATVPRVFVNGKFVGGGDETKQLLTEGKFRDLISKCAPEKLTRCIGTEGPHFKE